MPAFSASLRSVAVATPPTPPVLHTAALGGSGPGTFGQLAFDVHCAWVTLHFPTGTHTAGTPTPVVQLMLVRMLHAPGMARQSVSFWQALPWLLHWPTFGQSCVVRHCVAGALEQKPNMLGQVASAWHAVLPLPLLHPPAV